MYVCLADCSVDSEDGSKKNVPSEKFIYMIVNRHEMISAEKKIFFHLAQEKHKI